MSAIRWMLMLGVASVLFQARTLWAQAVQLPTLSSFSVATTVLVPDRGGAYMGGVGRVRSGRNQYGAPGRGGNAAFGFEHHAAGLHASAHIHDLRGMDEALLRGAKPQASSAGAPQVSREAPLLSLHEIAQQKALDQQREAVDLARRGREAQMAGKSGLAKTYYQMALRRATGELHEQITAQIAQLAPDAPARVAVKP